MDIGVLLKLKGLIGKFKNNHPRVIAFLSDAGHFTDTGSIVEISITGKDGHKMTTNMRVTDSDLELFKAVSDLTKQ